MAGIIKVLSAIRTLVIAAFVFCFPILLVKKRAERHRCGNAMKPVWAKVLGVNARAGDVVFELENGERLALGYMPIFHAGNRDCDWG